MNSTVAGPGHAPRPVRHKDLPAILYGIRHHGPGSARSVRAALAEQRPDVLLIEGPQEADGLVALAADDEMRPPVALLGYVPGEPQWAAFWPFAVFSPEWQAIGYALGAGIPVRFCDLPAAHQLAMTMKGAGEVGGDAPRVRTDPVAELATAAGYDDPERWWEDVVEHVPGPAVFDALAEAIGMLRAGPAEADLRDEGIPASPAHVIESVRLAEALAALRGRPLAGLEEVTEAARSVLCGGSDLLTALIQRRLVVGER